MSDEDNQKTFIDLVKYGVTIYYVCQAKRLNRQTFYDFCKDNPEFKKRVDKARRRETSNLKSLTIDTMTQALVEAEHPRDKTYIVDRLWSLFGSKQSKVEKSIIDLIEENANQHSQPS